MSYSPSPETPGMARRVQDASTASGNRPERAEWFKDQALGLFIHWNLDSRLGSVMSHSMVGASQDYLTRYIARLPKTFNVRPLATIQEPLATTRRPGLWNPRQRMLSMPSSPAQPDGDSAHSGQRVGADIRAGSVYQSIQASILGGYGGLVGPLPGQTADSGETAFYLILSVVYLAFAVLDFRTISYSEPQGLGP